MHWFRSSAAPGATLLGLLLVTSGSHVAAQAAADAPAPHKSVRGTLASVDTRQNGVVMKSDGGERLAWQFSADVVAEVARFKPGDPMIVIYRQIAANSKRVTAVAFPGSESKPIYQNMTGARVVMRSTAAVNGVCGEPGAQQVSESIIPNGGLAEVTEGCWCCASPGETCTPGNKSGAGRALLVQCFK